MKKICILVSVQLKLSLVTHVTWMRSPVVGNFRILKKPYYQFYNFNFNKKKEINFTINLIQLFFAVFVSLVYCVFWYWLCCVIKFTTIHAKSSRKIYWIFINLNWNLKKMCNFLYFCWKENSKRERKVFKKFNFNFKLNLFILLFGGLILKSMKRKQKNKTEIRKIRAKK